MTGSETREFDSFTRREFLKGAGTVGLAAAVGLGGLLSGCEVIGGGDPDAVHLVHFIWAGSGQGIVPREVRAEFVRDHPEVSIELYEGSNKVVYPQMLAQKEVNPDDPLVNFGFFNVDATTKGILDDMWVSLDEDKIPHLADIYPQYINPENKGVAWGISQSGLIYNTELVDEPPVSWNDMFHPRFRGKVATYDYAWGYNGLVAVAYANGGDEENMDVAFDLFAQAARDGQFHSFFDQNQVAKDLLTRGEALLVSGFTKMAIPWKAEGAPVTYAMPEEGVGAFPLFFQIVKGSSERQIDVASRIIDIYLSPETLSRYCNLTATTPTSRYAKLDKDLIMEPSMQPEVTENAINFDWVAIAEHNQEWKEWWDREVKAHM